MISAIYAILVVVCVFIARCNNVGSRKLSETDLGTNDPLHQRFMAMRSGKNVNAETHQTQPLVSDGPHVMFFVVLAFLLVVVALGVALLLFGRKEVAEAKASLAWPSVPGVVRESKVAAKADDIGRSASSGRWTKDSTPRYVYQAAVAYEYEVNGKKYSGTRIAVGDLWRGDRSVVVEIVGRYPCGCSVSVFHDPENPSACVLEPGVRGQTWFLSAIGAVFMAVGIFFVILHVIYFRD